MSLPVAVACALLAALCYGTSTAVQHQAVHLGTGRADLGGLLGLLRNPTWLLSVLGDGVGLAFQVVALLTGPVVLVQPLLVLAVPLSLLVGSVLGGRRPSRSDYLASAAIVAALGAFALVVGVPGSASPLSVAAASLATGLLVALGGAACLAVRRRSPSARAVVYGSVAGASFGLVGVLLDATSVVWQRDGWDGLSQPASWVPIGGVLVVGGFAMVLTQVSFQVGALSASFPANEAAAPVVGVALGAWLLSEQIPSSAAAATAYAVCFVVMLAGTVRLARGWTGTPQAREGSAGLP